MKKGFARFATKEIPSESIVDGEGIRSVIWFQGCSHNCPGCHNPETHDFNAGVVVSIEEMKAQIDELDIVISNKMERYFELEEIKESYSIGK